MLARISDPFIIKVVARSILAERTHQPILLQFIPVYLIAATVAVCCRPGNGARGYVVLLNVHHRAPNIEPGSGVRLMRGFDRESLDHHTSKFSYSDGDRDLMSNTLGHFVDCALDSKAS